MIQLSRIWKLYIAYTFLLVVSMTLAGFFLDHQIKRRLQVHLGEDALTAARIVAAYLPEDRRAASLDAFCRQYRQVAGWRLTLVRPDGVVVGDSEQRPALMENHRGRTEIRRALADGQGTAVRRSPTLGIEMLYGAHLDPRTSLVVRVALPMERVQRMENEVMAVAAAFLYFAPLLCAILSFFTARALERRPRARTDGRPVVR